MGFAALWIYAFHILPREVLAFIPLRIGEYFLATGFCGVDMFLLVSGFGLVYSFEKNPVATFKDYIRFIKKRLWRLYIVFLPATIVIAYFQIWTFPQFVQRLVGVDQLFRDMYSHLWFLPCILVFYFLSPLYYRLYKKVKPKLLFTLLLVALSVTLAYVLRAHIRLDMYAIVHRIPVFLLGFYFGDLSRRETKKTKIVSWIVLVPVTAAGFVYSYLMYVDILPKIMPVSNAFANLFIAPGMVFLLAQLFTLLNKAEVSGAVAKVFAFWGTISFEFYCIQEFAWAKFCEISSIGNTTRQVLCFISVTVASVVLSYLGKMVTKYTAKK